MPSLSIEGSSAQNRLVCVPSHGSMRPLRHLRYGRMKNSTADGIVERMSPVSTNPGCTATAAMPFFLYFLASALACSRLASLLWLYAFQLS